MSLSARHQLIIAATGLVVFFTGLGATHLWDQDEAFFARSAVEMQQRDQWVVPYFNDQLFAHKPPFMFWMMRIGFLLFGTTELAARFGSAVFGLATALLVYRLGRRTFNPSVGLWAALAMSTALMFDVVARAATPDSYLVFFSTLALYVFIRNEHWQDDRLPASAFCLLQPAFLMYAVMGVAVLVKGPIGVILPTGVIGLYLLTRDPAGQLPADPGWGDRLLLFLRRFTPARLVHTAWTLRPLTAIAAILLVAGPWFALVAWRTDGQFLREFFGVHNYGRFMNPMDNHGGPIWYYVPAVLAGFFPWSIFAVPTAIDLVRRCRGGDQGQRGARFLACWIAVFVGFFSLAGTKLPNYVLPAYPALALTTACFIDRWLTRPQTVHRWWPRLSFGSLLLVGLAMAIVPPMLAHQSGDGRSLLERLGASPEIRGEIALVALLGAILMVGAVAGIVLAELRSQRKAAAVLAVTAVTFSLATFSVVAVRLDRHQPSPALAQTIHRQSTGSPRVAQFGYFRPSLVYYADTRVDACKTPQRVADFLRQSPNAFVITTEEHYSRLTPYLPAEALVLDRHEEFPRCGTVLVLGRKPSVAQAPHAPAH